MLLGIVGKSNTGKTTLFSAATLVDAEISNRIFTTIEPNKGVTYVRVECPCKKLGVTCNPKNSKCANGARFVPIKMVDIAGLVPDAHKGRGLGNQFLSDIMEADALIHVVDISGSTDESGNPVAAGTRDPKEDIKFLEEEIDYWILGILKRNLHTLSKRMEATKEKFTDIVYKQLSGLGIKLADVEHAMAKAEYSFDDYELLKFIRLLREKSKPMLLAANKIDIAGSETNLERLKDLGYELTPCSAESELALRRAAEKGIIEYNPGDKNFKMLAGLDERHKKALDFIRRVIEKYGSTGVQKIIDTAVFDVLNMIVVYPVENEHKFSDSHGNVLPHAHLIKEGLTVKELASKIHTDLADKFIGAIDAKSGKRIGESYKLKNNDIIKILVRH